MLPIAWLAIMSVFVARAWALCGGNLVFTLDDPLIHMAVSESILNGTYGINCGEPSAPSSSILWPFLLAPFELIGWGLWGPLAINICAMLAAVVLLGQMLKEALPALSPWGRPVMAWSCVRLGIGLLICLACNSWGLVMTGMEHPLHVFATLLFARASLDLAENPSGKVTLLAATACALPLIRFEGAASAAAACLLLIWLGRRRESALLASLLLLELIAWTAFTHFQGLPVMPSSVQMKSPLVSGIAGMDGIGRVFALLLHNLKISFAVRQGAMLMVLMTAVGLLVARASRISHFRYGVMILLMALAHICFGQYGWFSRYEIYVLALLFFSILVLGRDLWVRPECLAGLACLLTIVAAPYVKTLIDTPPAARSIYEQQVQMRRFAVDFWKQPVAVVDLGWVSYRNPSYVLDLEGLGSEEVRKLRKAGMLDAEHVEALARRHHVRLAMVYDERVGHVFSRTWIKVAVLKTSVVASPSDKVCFYVSGQDLRRDVAERLKSFEKELPSGSKLEFIP